MAQKSSILSIDADLHLARLHVKDRTATRRSKRRDTSGVVYDFAQKIEPGRYFLFSMVTPKSNADYRIADARNAFGVLPGATVYLGTWTVTLGIPTTRYAVDYDMAEIGLFAKANPSRDMTKFMIGAPGKAAVPLKAQ